MAEVIGLAASLITLVGASAELARTLLKVANLIDSAAYEARLIATDISVFSCSLTQLSKIVELPHPETHKLREITAVLIGACQILISDLTKLIGDPISFHNTPRALLLPWLRIRFRWMMNGPKVMFIKSLVDSFKSTIILLVSTMDLAAAIHGNAPESIKECLKTQVRSNIFFAEDATETLVKYTGKEGTKTRDRTLEARSSALEDSYSIDDGSETLRDANSVLSITSDANDQNQLMLRTDPNVEVHAPEQVADSDDDQHGENHLQLIKGCDQIVQIQKQSCDLAQHLLETSVVQQTWNWGGTHQSVAETASFDGQSRIAMQEQHYKSRHQNSEREHSGQVSGYSTVDIIDVPKAQMNQGIRRDEHVRSNDVERTEPYEVQDRFEAQTRDLQQSDNGSRPDKQTYWSDHRESIDSQLRSHSRMTLDEGSTGRQDGKSQRISPIPVLDSTSDHDSRARVDDWRSTFPNQGAPDTLHYYPENLFKPQRENSHESSLPNPPPPPPEHSKEDSMLRKLEKMLLGKAEEDEKSAEAARQAAENAKFNRLEKLLISQQEAKIEKEKQKLKAAEEAARAAADARKKGDEDKLAKLEKLILAQKEDQLRREAAAEAARAAEKAEADAYAARVALEKKMAAEKAKDLLDAAKSAREEAEKKAAMEAEETKQAHERALLNLKLAQEEAAKSHASALEEARKMEKLRLEDKLAKEPVIVQDIIGRKLSCPWHACNTPEALETFLRQNSAGAETVLEYLEKGDYDMLKNDIVVTPQLWDDMVFPGSFLKMRSRIRKSPRPPPDWIPPPPPPMPILHKNTGKKFKWHRSLRWD